jgi:hypothetical protein
MGLLDQSRPALWWRARSSMGPIRDVDARFQSLHGLMVEACAGFVGLVQPDGQRWHGVSAAGDSPAGQLRLL